MVFISMVLLFRLGQQRVRHKMLGQAMFGHMMDGHRNFVYQMLGLTRFGHKMLGHLKFGHKMYKSSRPRCSRSDPTLLQPLRSPRSLRRR